MCAFFAKRLLMVVVQVQEVEDIPDDAARWTGDKVRS